MKRERFGRRGAAGHRILLASGIASSLVYVAANVLGARRWPGYSLASQTVSELSAIDAPSRPVMVPLLTAHGALLLPFGLGVRRSAGRRRGLRASGALLIGLAATDLPAPLFPMHRREALARGDGSRTDTMHIAFTGVNSLLILLAIAFGSPAFGQRFRVYSLMTLLVLGVTGGLTVTQAPRVEANLPTPWAGVAERVSIAGYLLWQMVLAIALLRATGTRLRIVQRLGLMQTFHFGCSWFLASFVATSLRSRPGDSHE